MNYLSKASVVAVMFFTCCVALGQDKGVVAGQGSATISKQPEMLRLTVQLSGEGKDMKEAIARLTETKEAAKTALAALNPIEGSIKFVDGATDSDETPQQRYMRQYAMMRNRSARPTTGPAMVSINTSLTAEWPLSAANHDELLIASSELQEKINAAMPKNEKKLTPEEQEILEEMQSMGSETGPTPGEPKFVFVRKISAEERQKLIAEAFAKARAEAELLAAAAGSQISALHRLQSGEADSSGNNMYAAMLAAQMGETTQKSTDSEAVSQTAGNIAYSVAVSAEFSLK